MSKVTKGSLAIASAFMLANAVARVEAAVLYELVVGTNSSTPQSVDPAFTPGGYVRGAGLVSNIGSTFNSAGFNTAASFAAALANNDFITWSFTSTSAFDLSDFDIRYDRSSTGPSNLRIELAINGGAFSTVLTDAAVDVNGETILGTSLSAFDNVTSGIFRYSGFGATSAGGTFDFENSASIANASFQLNGDLVGVVGSANREWAGGVAGTWTNLAGGWIDPSIPAAATWDSSVPHNAFFTGTAPLAVTVNSGIITNDFTLSADGYSFAGQSLTVEGTLNAQGTTTFGNAGVVLDSAAPSIILGAGKTVTFNAPLTSTAAASSISVTGGGTVVLNANSTSLPLNNFGDSFGLGSGATLVVNATINGGVFGAGGANTTVTGTGTITGEVNHFATNNVASTPSATLTLGKLATSGNVGPGGANGAGIISVDAAVADSSILSGAGMASFFNGANYFWDLFATTDAPANAGTLYDQVFASSVLLDAGSELIVDLNTIGPAAGPNAFWNSNHVWKVLDTDETTNVELFGLLTISNQTGFESRFSQLLGSGANAGDVFLVYSAPAGIPEPATLGLFAVGGALLLRRRK